MSYLYKYRSMNKYHLSALNNDEIWFSLGSKFNDPFDCTLNVPVNIMTGASMLEFIKQRTSAYKLLELGAITHENINNLALKYINDTQKLVDEDRMDEHPLSTVFNLVLASLQRSFVCCFSKNATNPLLWSHYADSHAGFCIRFQKEKLVSSLKPRLIGDVVYSDSPVDLFTAFNDSVNVASDIIYRKSLCWKYEDEVRLIHNDFSENKDDFTKVEIYSKDAIDCVILGYNFDMSKLSELKEVVNSDSVIYKKIVRGRDSYKLFISPERL